MATEFQERAPLRLCVDHTNRRGIATRKSSCNCGKLSLTYDGPDPERISLCQCYECQRRTAACSACKRDFRSST
jgi:hypothetical protein